MDSDIKNFIREENEKLASMIASGFAEVHGKIAEIHETMATKTEMNARFDRLEQHNDRVEKSYDYRLTSLERDVAELKTATAG